MEGLNKYITLSDYSSMEPPALLKLLKKELTPESYFNIWHKLVFGIVFCKN